MLVEGCVTESIDSFLLLESTDSSRTGLGIPRRNRRTAISGGMPAVFRMIRLAKLKRITTVVFWNGSIQMLYYISVKFRLLRLECSPLQERF